MEHHNEKVIVLGMGRTGKAVCEYLKGKGASVEGYDDILLVEKDKNIFCKSYDYAVISPGIPMENPAVLRLKESGVPILSELDLAYINSPSKRVFAVSGTNGKTTTCTILNKLLSTVCKSHLVGNVGVPWIGEVQKIDKRDFIVVEVSSFQLEQSQFFRPYVAALTNVGEDHLDRHFTRERYQRIKLSLLQKATVKVINLSDPVQRAAGGTVSYSAFDEKADFYLKDHAVFCYGKRYELPGVSLGAAYDLDFLCALASASSYFGIKRSFLSLYDKIKVPAYRCQYVGKLCGAEVYNDSKGTNIDATLFAVSQFHKSLSLILGGSDKGEDYERLFLGLGEQVETIYLTGANSREMYLAATGKMRKKCRVTESLELCVADFVRHPTSVLLFSPASASFDRYKNYEERGKCFDEIVKKYANGATPRA